MFRSPSSSPSSPSNMQSAECIKVIHSSGSSNSNSSATNNASINNVNGPTTNSNNNAIPSTSNSSGSGITTANGETKFNAILYQDNRIFTCGSDCAIRVWDAKVSYQLLYFIYIYYESKVVVSLLVISIRIPQLSYFFLDYLTYCRVENVWLY